MIPILILFAVMALAVPVAAQEDACTQDQPCPWIISVDEEGIYNSSLSVMTQGDWYTVTVHNDDLSQAHTVTLSGYDVVFQVAALDEQQRTVEMATLGSFEVRDAPTGATVPFEVIAGDAVDFENGVADAEGNPRAGSKGTPGIGVVAGVLAVGLAVAMTRRGPSAGSK